MGREEYQNYEDEIFRIREKLSRINEKVKRYSSLINPNGVFDVDPNDNRDLEDEDTLEDMHSKLSSINSQIKKRVASGKIRQPIQVPNDEDENSEPEKPSRRRVSSDLTNIRDILKRSGEINEDE
ncbi:MAG: hypothetical protein HQL29_00865, partial [Candidatus Omnitrophica bacterium]|nr:hypothetical protein [Candidatus Omnitrophota bacterium]